MKQRLASIEPCVVYPEAEADRAFELSRLQQNILHTENRDMLSRHLRQTLSTPLSSIYEVAMRVSQEGLEAKAGPIHIHELGRWAFLRFAAEKPQDAD